MVFALAWRCRCRSMLSCALLFYVKNSPHLIQRTSFFRLTKYFVADVQEDREGGRKISHWGRISLKKLTPSLLKSKQHSKSRTDSVKAEQATSVTSQAELPSPRAELNNSGLLECK